MSNEEGGWFPKVTGIMDVLDKGLNKVIGVDEAPKSHSPIIPQVNVEAEKRLDPPVIPTYQGHQVNEHVTPVGGFDPFSRRSSVESRVSASPKQWEQPFTSNTNVPSQTIPVRTTPQTWNPPTAYETSSSTFAPQSFIPHLGKQPQPVQKEEPFVPPQQSPSFNQQPWTATSHSPQPSSQASPYFPQAPVQQFQQSAPSSFGMSHQQSMPNLSPSNFAEPGTEMKPSHHDPIKPNMAAMSMDDFGFGNRSSVKQEPPQKQEELSVDDGKDSETGSKGSILGGLFKGIFGRKKENGSPALSTASAGSGPVQANLGESELKLVYDETRKQWVRKDTGAPPVAEVSAPPPPSISHSSMGSDTASPISYRRPQAAGARGKYVDAFGSENIASAPTPSIPQSTLIPTPSFTNLSLAPEDPPSQQLPPQQPVQQPAYHQQGAAQPPSQVSAQFDQFGQFGQWNPPPIQNPPMNNFYNSDGNMYNQ